MKSLFNRIQEEIGHPIIRIKSDKGRNFNNVDVDLFCESKDTIHDFSVLRTSQQNGLAERKIRVLQEMARVMIHMHDT